MHLSNWCFRAVSLVLYATPRQRYGIVILASGVRYQFESVSRVEEEEIVSGSPEYWLKKGSRFRMRGSEVLIGLGR